MKRLLLLVLCLIGVCGCAHQYVMKLTNGMQISTPGKPKLKGDAYYFKDAYGREHSIPQSRVLVIQPESMAVEENKPRTISYPKPKTHWWQFWK
jgi:hypothetical protein